MQPDGFSDKFFNSMGGRFGSTGILNAGPRDGALIGLFFFYSPLLLAPLVASTFRKFLENNLQSLTACHSFVICLFL